MNLLIILTIISGVNLYFLKNSSDLMVRYTSKESVNQITIYYSFSGNEWNSITLEPTGNFFDGVIAPPEGIEIVGIYAGYPDGRVDDNKGMLYLFEIKSSPRMLLPFKITDLEVMLRQARKKIISGKHIDEAITLLNYVERMIEVMPYVKGTELEIKKNILNSELEELKRKVIR